MNNNKICNNMKIMKINNVKNKYENNVIIICNERKWK